MNYKTRRELPGLPAGSIFTQNPSHPCYDCQDWCMKKETVESNIEWFEVTNELQKQTP